MTGSSVSGFSSAECAAAGHDSSRRVAHQYEYVVERGVPERPTTFRANSITAIWKPRQIPKYGTCFSRAHFAAAIIPSVPRSPNPPGTRIPLRIRYQRLLREERLDGLCATNRLPSSVELFRTFLLCLHLEIRRVDPLIAKNQQPFSTKSNASLP